MAPEVVSHRKIPYIFIYYQLWFLTIPNVNDTVISNSLHSYAVSPNIYLCRFHSSRLTAYEVLVWLKLSHHGTPRNRKLLSKKSGLILPNSTAQWSHVTSVILVNIGPGNGLFPDITKSLHEPVVPYHEWGHLPFTKQLFLTTCSRCQSLNVFVNCKYNIAATSPSGPFY